MSLNDELERQGNWLFCRRSLLPILVLAATFLDFLHGLIAPNDFFAFVRDAFPHYRYFCLAVSLAGLAVRIHTVGHAPAGTSGRNTRGQVADTLNTTGFYSIIRHPLYFGNLLISLGIVLLTADPASCSSLCSPFRSTTNESCMPKNSFSRASSPNGTAAGVGTFPPFFRSSALGGGRSRSSPSGKFFDRKKNGLVAIFLIFTFFHLAELFVEERLAVDYVLLGLTAASVLLYLALRCLKKSRLCDYR
mgnify:FL=1